MDKVRDARAKETPCLLSELESKVVHSQFYKKKKEVTLAMEKYKQRVRWVTLETLHLGGDQLLETRGGQDELLLRELTHVK